MKVEGTILVTGATGNQGGATARHLLENGHRVRALVRDPATAAAKRLGELGVHVVRGDMEDAESLRAAMDGADGVFSVQALAYEPPTLKAEVLQGKLVAEVAAQTGVQHLVYSSVGGAERQTGIEHFESKAEIERHISKLGIPATILRPVFFMNNLLYYADAVEERVIALPALPERPMQLIASDDIGRIAAYAFDHPDEFIGGELEIAAEELTFPQIAEIYERVTSTPTRFESQPIDDTMFEWLADSGYQADVPALRKRFPGLLSFEQFLRNRLTS